MKTKEVVGLYVSMCLMTGLVNTASFDADAYITSMVGLSFRNCINECIKRVSCKSLILERRSTFCRLYNKKYEVFSQTRIPGLMYWDSDGWPVVEQKTTCTGGSRCKEGETCEGKCIATDCTVLSTNPEIQFLGNLRTIGSKVKYTCRIGEPKSKISTCTEKGTWSEAGLACKAYGYRKYSNRLMYNSIPLFSLYNGDLLDCMKSCNKTKCLGFNFHVNETCISFDIIGVGWSLSTYDKEWEFYYKTT